MRSKRIVFLIVLILGLLATTVLGSNAETLFYKGSFNANGNCAYYGTFPSFDQPIYMNVNDGEHYYGLIFSNSNTELILQSGTVVFKLTNGYWITTRSYQCWTELGISPATITLYTSPPSDTDFGDGNKDYNESVSPLLKWAFGSEFKLYTIDGLQDVLTDVSVFEFVTLLFTPRVFLSVVYYLGFSLICTLVLGFIPMLFLFVWKFLLSCFFGKKRWFKK